MPRWWTPSTASQPQWWDPSRIAGTVTRPFVESHLLPRERGRLDLFGPLFVFGTSSSSYWDWIRTRGLRVFLVLVDLGVAARIFSLADSGWDDSKLPIPLETVPALGLTPAPDRRLEHAFFERQFWYLVQPLRRGEHRSYADPELVPVEVVDRRPAGLSGPGQVVDRVRLPNQPGLLFCRRQFQLGTGPGQVAESSLMQAIEHMKAIQADHMVSCWASYAHREAIYVLFTPASDLSLRTFLAGPPPSSFRSVPSRARRELAMNWILCLADTLCSLHERGRSHGCIKPSTVLLDRHNRIFFADASRISPESWIGRADPNKFDRERYDYGAPEQWARPGLGTATAGTRRQQQQQQEQRQQQRQQEQQSPSATSGPSFAILGSSDRTPPSPVAMMRTASPDLDLQAADVFSLGCIILELLTFLVKRRADKFAAHRSRQRRAPGRGGAVADTSFHQNLAQVEVWMSEVATDGSVIAARAGSRDDPADGGQVLLAVTPMLDMVARMLSASSRNRPSAYEVRQHIHRVLVEWCGIAAPHCGRHHDRRAGDGGGGGSGSGDGPKSPLERWGRAAELDSTPARIVSSGSAVGSISSATPSAGPAEAECWSIPATPTTAGSLITSPSLTTASTHSRSSSSGEVSSLAGGDGGGEPEIRPQRSSYSRGGRASGRHSNSSSSTVIISA